MVPKYRKFSRAHPLEKIACACGASSNFCMRVRKRTCAIVAYFFDRLIHIIYIDKQNCKFAEVRFEITSTKRELL